MSATFEREIKLRFDDPDAAKAAVTMLAALPFRPRRLQRDFLLDTPDGLLQGQRLLLRVRVEPSGGIVTVKGPVLDSAMKLREEMETNVASGEKLLQMFERMGFRVWFRYEKYREEFTTNGLVIAIDETPIGTFMEIEGDEGLIKAAATRLGRASTDYILDSYRGLFLRQCEERGIPPGDMLLERD